MNRKTVTGIVIGALLIVAGICIFGQATGMWDLSLLMNGWWTLFLIVPALTGMIVSGPRPSNVCLMLLGVWLFAECQGWLGGISRDLLLGIFLVIIGAAVITGWGRRPGEHRHHHHRHHDSMTEDGAQQD